MFTIGRFLVPGGFQEKKLVDFFVIVIFAFVHVILFYWSLFIANVSDMEFGLSFGTCICTTTSTMLWDFVTESKGNAVVVEMSQTL